MTTEQVVQFIRSELARRACIPHREGVRNFFNHEIDPWGVRSSQLVKVEQDVARELKGWPQRQRFELWEELWRTGKFEEPVLLCHVARKFAKEYGKPEFRTFERWLKTYVNNWAHCDGVSTWLVASCIKNEPHLAPEMLRWAGSKNRWVRRAAAVSLLQEGKAARLTDAIVAVARKLEGDADDMVQKGVGWVLKETYVRSPEVVMDVMADWHGARLVVRYAAEKMSAAHREQLGLSSGARKSRSTLLSSRLRA